MGVAIQQNMEGLDHLHCQLGNLPILVKMKLNNHTEFLQQTLYFNYEYYNTLGI